MIPEKISRALENVMEVGEVPVIAIKTAWKPNHSTPTLWLAVTNQRVLLFSTLRGGQMFNGARFKEVNTFAAEEGRRIKILFCDTTVPDLFFQVDESASPEVLKQLVSEVGARLKC